MSDEPRSGELSSIPTRTFAGDGIHGEITLPFAGSDLIARVQRLIDPTAAVETIYWGRNYLYSSHFDTGHEVVEVVVKQFRNQGLRRSLDRRWRGSKARRSWRVAHELVRHGFNTPRPVLLVESDAADGPSYFVSERLRGATEVRQFFRRLNDDPAPSEFPVADDADFLAQLGRFARRLHDAGVIFRDLSIGNVLARPTAGDDVDLVLLDLNRARIHTRPGLWRRIRDICRFPVIRTDDRRAFLRGYWGVIPSRWDPRWWLYVASVDGHLAKHAFKNRLRSWKPGHRHGHGGMHHAHIPPATKGASARDKTVWDYLSDQPHQHAGKWEKRWIRLVDAPSHVRDLALVVAAAPRVWRRYRELEADLYQRPTVFQGIGLCVRPYPADPAAHLAAIEELGVRSVLLRLHPWEDDHRAEEMLARELAARGMEVSFVLPQNRELVRDLDRWRSKVAELADTFSVFGSRFQIGQAINRSKWGVWSTSEYVELFRSAAEVLRRTPGVELLGPAVIDFEFQSLLALLERHAPGLEFDAVASLLYVDRRGAPENRQLGFDTVSKVVLLRAIADVGRNSRGRCWITEVNWPLWEGPHSPAGRSVSVDEEKQADYLVRYYLETLGTGLVERVFWWRLVARGYGLMVTEDTGGLRRRPAFQALKTLHGLLDGWSFSGPVVSPAGSWIYRFERDGLVQLVGWTRDHEIRVHLPGQIDCCWSRDGHRTTGGGDELMLSPAPQYVLLRPS
jgi:tRNA A-37 threonylcarbamoyl transferase component Bud32